MENFLFSHIVSVLLKTVLILCKYFLSFTSSLYRLQTDSVLCKYFLQFEKTFCFHIEFLSVEIFPVFYKCLISNVKVLYCANIAKGIFRLQKFSLLLYFAPQILHNSAPKRRSVAFVQKHKASQNFTLFQNRVSFAEQNTVRTLFADSPR